ncbi:MAG: hypothetical protein JXA90_15465, partial [Planctomycetes bacterium]|nr:hypothetical protein [Planctomycetota bacterium]
MLDALLEKLRVIFHPHLQRGLRVGKVLGVEIWIHWWLIIVAVIQLFYCLFILPRGSENPRPLVHWVLFLISLPPSILLHELGHLWFARRMGGGASRLVLSPVGGLEPCEAPMDPESQFRVATGGPLATFILLVGAACVCALASWRLLPFGSQDSGLPIPGLMFQYFVLWNAFLLIVNAIPCYPTDAGRMLLAAAWARSGSYPRAAQATLAVSRLLAILVLAAAAGVFIFSLGRENFSLEHPLANNLAMGFLLVGFLHFQDSRRLLHRLEFGEEDRGIFGYDFSLGYTSLEHSLPGGPPASTRVRGRPARRSRRLAD